MLVFPIRQRQVKTMLIFRCTGCEEVIIADDDEDPDATCNRLMDHIAKCQLATFDFEATTEAARQTIDVIRSVIRDKLKLRLH
jgi:hypothetical protein